MINKSMVSRRRAFVLASATTSLFASSHWALADSYTYTGATFGTWTVNANWSSLTGTTYPGTSNDAAFLNDTSSNRLVIYPVASGAAGVITAAVGTLSLTETSAAVNEVDYDQSGTGTFSITNPVILGASGGGTSQLFADPLPTSGNRAITIVAPSFTLNAGGVLEFGSSKNVVSTAQDSTNLVGNVLIAGGTLFNDIGEGDSIGTDALASNVTGTVMMTSGTISLGVNGPNGNAATLKGVANQGLQTNDRLNFLGSVAISGGTIVSTNAAQVLSFSGASTSISNLSNGTITAQVTVGSTTSYTAGSPQTFRSDSAIPGVVQFRQTAAGSGVAVGAITSFIQFGSFTPSKTLFTGQLVYQNSSNFGSQTLQLMSNVTGSSNLGQSGNKNSVSDTLDLNGFNLDLSANDALQGTPTAGSGSSAGSFTITNSQAGAGSVSLFKAGSFIFNNAGGTTVGANVNLVATGVSGTSTFSGGLTSISPQSTFTFAPTASGVGSLTSSVTMGNLVISAQTLNMASAITTGSTSTTTIASVGTLNLNGYALTTSNLQLNGGTISGSTTGSALSVSGTFAGTGTVGAAAGITVGTSSTGVFSPGGAGTVGTLKLATGTAAITFASGDTANFDVTGNASNDVLNLNSITVAYGGALALNFTYTPTTTQVYTLFQNVGGESGSFTLSSNLSSDDSLAFNPANGQLTVTVTPEPASLALIGISSMLLLRRRRRTVSI